MPLPASAPPLERRLMREEAYERLRELIVSGALEPDEALRDQDLAAWLGVSRMPVREALARLADDGLVTIAANRFTRVAPLDPAQVHEAHRLIALIEPLLLGLPREGASHAAIGGLAERFQWALWRSDADEALAADGALHAAARTDRASLAAGMLNRLEPIARRGQRAAWPRVVGGWPVEAHAALTDALLSGDHAAAREAVASEWLALAEMASGGLGRG